MKRFVACLLTLLVFAGMAHPCYAAGAEQNTETICFEDGSYIVVELQVEQASRSRLTRSGTKSYTYYSADSELVWVFTLYGTFSYEPGVSCLCSYSDCDVTVYDDSWSCTEQAAYCRVNTAVGIGTMVRKVAFIPTATREVEIVLTCDTYGNIT